MSSNKDHLPYQENVVFATPNLHRKCLFGTLIRWSN